MQIQIQTSIDQQLIIISVPTVQKILNYPNGANSLSLYNFYCYTAKIQKTNQIYALPVFCKKGLHWGDIKFKKADKILRELKLITKIQDKDPKTGKIKGWYVKINYLWTTNKERELKPEALISTCMETQSAGKQKTNALSVININALSEKLNTFPSAVADGEFSLLPLKSKIKEPRIDSSPVFDQQAEIQKLRDCPKRHISLIGLLFTFYVKFLGFAFDSRKEFEKALSRNLRDASILASMGYKDTFYAGLFEYTAKKLVKIDKESVPIFHLATTLRFKDAFKLEYPDYKKLNDAKLASHPAPAAVADKP